jgi:type IV secretory pathway VirB10-like protein
LRLVWSQLQGQQYQWSELKRGQLKMDQPKKTPVSKNWLKYVLATLVVVAAATLLYRSLTGQSTRVEREQRQQEKEQKSLEGQRAGDPFDFSAKLANQRERVRKEMEEDRKKAIAGSADQEKNKAAGETTPSGQSSKVIKGPSAPAAAPEITRPYPGSPVPGYSSNPASNSSTSATSGMSRSTRASDSEEAELNEAEKKRAMLGIRSSKIAAFEDDARANAPNPRVGGIGSDTASQLAKLDALTANLTSSSDPMREALRAQILNSLKNDSASNNSGTVSSLGVGSSTRNQDDSSASFLKNVQATSGTNATGAVLLPSPATSPFTLHQGALMPVVLLSDINSDLPGTVRAMVTRDVYDSIDLARVVIPRGAVILAPYNSETVPGQERVLIAGARLIFPNGSSINLSTAKATDRQGNSGLAADVDNRFWKIFGTSFIIAGLTKASTPQSGDAPTVNINLSGQVSSTAASVLADTAKKVLERNQNIKPTLRLFKGEPFNFVVAQDMVLPPSIVLKRSF